MPSNGAKATPCRMTSLRTMHHKNRSSTQPDRSSRRTKHDKRQKSLTRNKKQAKKAEYYAAKNALNKALLNGLDTWNFNIDLNEIEIPCLTSPLWWGETPYYKRKGEEIIDYVYRVVEHGSIYVDDNQLYFDLPDICLCFDIKEKKIDKKITRMMFYNHIPFLSGKINERHHTYSLSYLCHYTPKNKPDLSDKVHIDSEKRRIQTKRSSLDVYLR